MKNDLKNRSDFILYISNDGEVKVDVMLLDDTVLLTQGAMQELFGRAKSTISEHIKNVFDEGELEESSTVRKYRTVPHEGKREVERDLEYYNLDVIISLGYRVRTSFTGCNHTTFILNTVRYNLPSTSTSKSYLSP